MTTTKQLWAIALGILTLGTAYSEEYAESFSEVCRGALPADRQNLFYAELRRGEQAIAAGNVRDAEQAMNTAQGTAWRGAAFDLAVSNDVGIKCLGEQTAKRWYAARLGLYRLLAAENSGDSDRVGQTNLILQANDGGSNALVNEISSEPAHRFRGAVGSLQQIAARVDKDREFGAYILPQENAVAAACRDAVSQLRKLADQKHRAALEAEDRAFNRPLSEQEISLAESAESAQAATMAIVGVNMDTGRDKEAPFIAMRVTESQRHLRDARAWDLDEYDDPTTEPSSRRALERGDTMLARANDPAQGLEMRDDLYQDAEKYFQFGGFSKQAKAAESQRDAIQPALQAEKARREQQRDAALEQKAAAMQQAVDDMQKTEAEKQSFNEEADAMEAELGF